MKAIFFILLFSTCALGQADPCRENGSTTLKITVKPDANQSLKPIIEALKKSKPGFNLIVDVQPGLYAGPMGILINKSDVCLQGQGKPILKRTKFSNEQSEPSVVKVYGVSNVVVRGFEIQGVIDKDNCPVGPAGVAIVNFSHDRISNIRISNNAVNTIGHDYNAHCFDKKKKEITKQAHGIQVVSNEDLVEKVVIEKNQLSNLRLGNSEALTVGGYIEDFSVVGNEIWNVDNIGIDIIGGSEDTPHQATWGRVTDNVIRDLKSGNSSYPFVAGIYIDGGTGISWEKPILIEKNTVSNFGIGISVGSENNSCDKAKGKAARCPVLTQFIQVTNNTIRANQVYGISLGKDVFDEEDQQNSQTWDVRVIHNMIVGNVRSPSAQDYGQIHFGSLEAESLKRIDIRDNHIANPAGGLLITVSGSTDKKYLLPDVGFYNNGFVSDSPGFVWTWGKTAEQLERYNKTRLTGVSPNQLKLPPEIKGENNLWKSGP